MGRAQRCVSSVRQRMVRLCPLRNLPDRPHRGGPVIEVAVMTGDNELGLARVRGRVLQDCVLGRRPVRLVQLGVTVVRGGSDILERVPGVSPSRAQAVPEPL